MVKKFTFKTNKPTERFRSVYAPYHDIKLRKIKVGSIDHDLPHKIRFMVVKKDLNEDGNSNCTWKWIRLKKKFESVEKAKEWLRENCEKIQEAWNLYVKED